MDREAIGRLIGALRREQGMTQRELAARLHVSDRTVSKWERGAGVPDASLMVAPADALGISVNELLTGERADASGSCAPAFSRSVFSRRCSSAARGGGCAATCSASPRPIIRAAAQPCSARSTSPPGGSSTSR